MSDPLQTLTTAGISPLFSSVQGKVGLTKQSLLAAAVAAYVGALVAFVTFQLWRFQTGADASMCPTEADWDRWCAGGELLLALVFDFLWALYGWPFAFVLTAPCALALGRLAPRLELHLVEPSLARAQYALGAALGLAAGLLLQEVVAALFAAFAGVWIFRRARYGRSRSCSPVP